MTARAQELLMRVRQLEVSIRDATYEVQRAEQQIASGGGLLPSTRAKQQQDLAVRYQQLHDLKHEHERARQEMMAVIGSAARPGPAAGAAPPRAQRRVSVTARPEGVRPLSDSLSAPRRLACVA